MFLLIGDAFRMHLSKNVISIHLMFLLIYTNKMMVYLVAHFNTSHVSINQRKRKGENYMNEYFNTSHVSINQRIYWGNCGWPRISIHLMFLLIGICNKSTYRIPDFNTSHVSINRNTALSSLPAPAFQYISCFY